MKKITIITILTMTCICCSVEVKDNLQVKDISKELNELILISNHVFNINAVCLNGQGKVVRLIDEKKMMEDTVLYILDKSTLYLPNQEDYLLYFKFCLKDVDEKFELNKFRTSIILDIFPKNGDSTKFEIGKLKYVDGKIEYGWKGTSNMASLDYPINLNEIDSNFQSYECYYFGEKMGDNVKSHMTLDYANSFGPTFDIESHITEGLKDFMSLLNKYNSENPKDMPSRAHLR